MTLINKATFYEARYNSIKTEKDMVSLVENVRHSISFLVDAIKTKPLLEILELIKQGKCRIPRDAHGDCFEEIDLSEARKLVDLYRKLSSIGCTHCDYKATLPLVAGTASIIYCSVKESSEEARRCYTHDSFGIVAKSPAIKQYENHECFQKSPGFRRLEEVLQEAETL